MFFAVCMCRDVCVFVYGFGRDQSHIFKTLFWNAQRYKHLFVYIPTHAYTQKKNTHTVTDTSSHYLPPSKTTTTTHTPLFLFWKTRQKIKKSEKGAKRSYPIMAPWQRSQQSGRLADRSLPWVPLARALRCCLPFHFGGKFIRRVINDGCVWYGRRLLARSGLFKSGGGETEVFWRHFWISRGWGPGGVLLLVLFFCSSYFVSVTCYFGYCIYHHCIILFT